MKAVNDGQEISNRLTIMILEKKKCLSENHLSDTPPCHQRIKTLHYTRCIAYQPMSALVDNEGTSAVDYRCYCRNDGRSHFVFTLSDLVEPF